MLRAVMKTTPKAKPHIGILGAGVAGLRTARLLLQKGYQVTVLEARDRVGGRLCQGKVGGHTVDLGPNWIHGTKNNPILDIIDELGVVKHDFGERQASFDSEGKTIDPVEGARVSEVLWEIIGEAFKYSQARKGSEEPIDKEQSLMGFIEGRLEERTDELGKRKVSLVKSAAEQWGLFIGGETKSQSLRFLWLEESLEGENLFCAGTYEKVLRKIARPVEKAGVIRFGHVVEKIISSSTGDGREKGSSVQVELRDGSNMAFDEVVVTMPLGWLKRNQEAFEPPLPGRMTEAIDAVGYGNLDKVLITFPTAWWTTPPKGSPFSPSSKNNINHPSSDRITTHPSPAPPNQTNIAMPLPSKTTSPESQHSTSLNETLSTSNNTETPAFTNWFTPTYTPSTNPTSRSQEAISLASMPPSTFHSTLLFYTSGPTSTLIARHLLTNPPSSLLPFFMPYICLLPNYNPSSQDCVPSDVLATAWENDEFAGFGSYSNFLAGQGRLDEDLVVLRDGMPERGVWIAGEHTSPFEGLGTVTGAWWSGERVAREIEEWWEQEQQDV